MKGLNLKMKDSNILEDILIPIGSPFLTCSWQFYIRVSIRGGSTLNTFHFISDK